jgi:phospholipid-transporting ATPase
MIEANGVQEEYQVLNILEFNSTRKRMSSIIRAPDGRILLYCKGADTVILERCASHQPYKETTLVHLEEYATEGLRTLCIAMREIPEQEYQPWSAIYERAAATVNGRTEEIDKASELIEKNLFLLGATAIEDKLQEGVPDTIYTLQQAGIKVWVLTGDRQETAINIGLSCRLISESMNLVIVNEESADATADFIHKRLLALRAASRDPTDSEDLALIIGLCSFLDSLFHSAPLLISFLYVFLKMVKVWASRWTSPSPNPFSSWRCYAKLWFVVSNPLSLSSTEEREADQGAMKTRPGIAATESASGKASEEEHQGLDHASDWGRG